MSTDPASPSSCVDIRQGPWALARSQLSVCCPCKCPEAHRQARHEAAALTFQNQSDLSSNAGMQHTPVCQASMVHPRGDGPAAQAPSADCSGADLMGEAAVCSTAALRSAISSAVRESSASSSRLQQHSANPVVCVHCLQGDYSIPAQISASSSRSRPWQSHKSSDAACHSKMHVTHGGSARSSQEHPAACTLARVLAFNKSHGMSDTARELQNRMSANGEPGRAPADCSGAEGRALLVAVIGLKLLLQTQNLLVALV